MKTMFAFSWHNLKRVCGWLVAGALTVASLGAQSLAPRISAEISNSERTTLTGSLHPFAQAQFDAGRVPANTKLGGVSIVFSRSAAQQADLVSLIAAQQDPSSPLYHQWLTPDQFATRFGVADADLDKVKSWLEQQGFAIDSVARSRSMIRFSGTARQVEGAFSTEMHYYNIEGARHFAPSSELSVPAAIAPVVLAVSNLSDFRPKPMHIAPTVVPDFTSSQSKFVHFAPGDIWKVYDINPLYQSGYTGAGQAIAIMGQSAIATSDIENFQNAAGLLIKDPTQVLVPGTGISTVYAGDESESDIDLEWSSAIATGANIIFVYVGSSQSSSVFDSILYAVDEDIAPIISVSYGACETEFASASALQPYEAAGQQASAQGQTLIASSGDSGSTSCSGFTNLTTAQQEALAVSYPASSAYFTAAGGTEISQANSAYMTSGSAYWLAANGSDVLNSALQYIPEVAWNDDSSQNGLSSTGGGASVFINRQSWQTGVQGITAGSKRLVPDISLYSSPSNPGYLFCSSDSSNGILGSCSNGTFRDGNQQFLTVAGGTSFAAPIFAGMVAIINQQKGYTGGQGLINPTLYTLAANSTTYASAFHDTTSGNNDCLAGTTLCANTNGFSTGTGYDEVTGLGSVELNNLVAAWPASPTVPTPIITTTTISTASFTPTENQPNTFSFSVAAASGTKTPTGSLKLSIDGGGTAYSTGGSTATVPLSGIITAGTASATYPATFTTCGMHQVVAQYSGDPSFAGSTGIIQVTVPAVGSFSIAATGVTVTQGNQSTTTITVTPKGGYACTVDITPSSTTASFCYSTTTATVPGTAAVTTTMTIDTNLSDCGATNAQKGSGKQLFVPGGRKASLSSRSSISVAAFSFAGLFLAGLVGWRRRQLRFLSCLIALGLIGFVLSGCGGGGGTTNPSNNYTTKGSYTITLTGQDSTTASLPTATTTFSLIVQ